MRQRLLNLTLKNKHLSFRHNERARGYVRIVDELPNVVFQCLSAQQMCFEPLPPITTDLEVEDTPKFKMALEEARLIDEVYQAELASNETQNDLETGRRIERSLKDRVREQLGMLRDRAARFP